VAAPGVEQDSACEALLSRVREASVRQAPLVTQWMNKRIAILKPQQLEALKAVGEK